MDRMVPPLIVLIIFGTFYKIFELFARRAERKMLIEKIAEISNVDFSKLNWFGVPSSWGRFTALRIGMLMLGVGFGIFCAVLVMGMVTNAEYFIDGKYNWRVEEVVFTSLICFFGGLSLVICYVIEQNQRNK